MNRRGFRTGPSLAASLLLAAALLASAPARAADPASDPNPEPAGAPTPRTASSDSAADAPEQRWALHGQSTFTVQFHPGFESPYRGAQSLDPGFRGNETWDATLFAGVRLWKGMELWANPEIDQGFGLSDTTGVAGFPSGEAYKVGKAAPYYRLQRLFLRQVINLGGETQKVAPDLNQLGGSQTADHIVITLGKISVGDIFDTNTYAHDPRNDFLNWTIIDTGTFDYAADSWAYTPGIAVELYKGRWVFRQGLFDLSTEPNSPRYDPTFTQFQMIEEIERDYKMGGKEGKVRLTGWLSRGRMGSFSDAIRLSEQTGQPADIAAVRHYQSRYGIGLDMEQQLSSQLGLFARAGWADGYVEPYEFTDVDRTAALGLQLKGARWNRPDDLVGLAGVVNGITKIHQEFLNDGGLGILVGDGKLPHYGPEAILETYYSAAVLKPVFLTFDYQYVETPGYNRDRGPVNVFAFRLHGQY
jgi:high affinity Mn2+ porin